MLLLAIRHSALAVLALLLAGCLQKPVAESIAVGHVAPLSGPDRPVGEHARNGILLAVKEANADDNRVLGRTVEVLHGDSQSDAELAQQTAVRLITVNKVTALLGGTDAARAEGLARAAQPYNVPVITAAATPGVPYAGQVYSVGISPAYQGQMLGKFAAEELKPARVAVVSDTRSALITALAASFVKDYPKGNPAARIDEWPFKSDGEFNELAARAHKAAPGLVVFAGSARDFVKFRAALRTAGVAGPFLFAGEDGSLPLLREDREAEGRAYLATAFAGDGGTEASREFLKKYRDHFGADPDVHAVLAYDSARLLFEALRQAHGTEGALVEKALSGTESFDSLTGPLTFTRDHQARRPVYVLLLEQGEAKVVKRYEPDK